MKASLQLRMSQQLNLTPQLAQSIRLLQLSTLEFQQELEGFLADNPLLERVEPSEAGEPTSDEPGSATNESQDAPELLWDEVRSGRSGDDDDYDPALNVPQQTTLQEYLQAQAALLPLSASDRGLIMLVIDALDQDGLLTQSLEELHEQFGAGELAELGIEPEDWLVVLRHVQQFDPPGVGARSLGESLFLQLRLKPESPARELAGRLVQEALDLLAQRDYTRLKRQLHCNEAELREAIALIGTLNPRPGAQWGNTESNYIVPDVVVSKVRGHWLVRLNGAAQPRLRVNEYYAKVLQSADAQSLSGQLQEARWLVKSIEQRGQTILRVAEVIVEKQKAFFELGEIAMRPLVLRDIAIELGLHESTVSRVTTQKFMLTPRGVLEFKYFFGSHVETDTGGECSATAIKAQIRQLVQNENKQKPLSDSALVEELARQGVVVARRTVAKYREMLQIPPVNQRKSL
ncbi:RNA polymerase factor sigma-54 [Chitinilyticum piscinae]|uniref:RNA polymerase sigma-54 factor n=1 Tax=Chitinilyticum piscinae TaxID=2866724 RepID=A0A8J7G216_9NEIS|nr:RNA polymerase factor sigma-54 [Chitinilyticum piscinae]MBE9610535.1 RNA polymerase factor sigma-54 [Chitinilyticum piscinae]